MNKIITISREFDSGGSEIGKRVPSLSKYIKIWFEGDKND